MSSLQESPKNWKDDIELVLKPREGATLNSIGLVDRRLFQGENELHAKQENGLWHFYYKSGIVPSALKQRFTSFDKAFQFADNYFRNRNIDIIDFK